MAICAPKNWFPPFTTGVSISGLPSFIPYTFVIRTDSRGIYEASVEPDHYCNLSSELSQTSVTYFSSPSNEDEDTPSNQQGAKFLRQLGECFLLRSRGRALASLCAKRINLKSFLVECNDSEGCRLHYWLRTKLQIYHGSLDLRNGVFLIDTDQLSAGLDSHFDSLDATCIISIERLTERALATAAAIKPMQIDAENLDTFSGKDGLRLFSSNQAKNLNQSASTSPLEFHSDKKVLHLVLTPVNFNYVRRRAIVDELICGEENDNRRHFDAIVPESFGSLSEISSAADMLQIYPGLSGNNLNYLLVMSPRSGSTALTELLARKGIGVPSEMMIPYCYNLLCTIENGLSNTSYIKFVLELFRDRNTGISGLQIDVDRLRATWRGALNEEIDRYIFYFRQSLSKQAVSMSLAVFYNLWFAYSPESYNQSLRALTFDQFHAQLLRLVRMQIYSLNCYLANGDRSIIVTNEQHLRNPKALYADILPHLGLSPVRSLSFIEDVNAKPEESMPTREVAGRDNELFEEKRLAFIQELGLEHPEGLLLMVPELQNLLSPKLISLFSSIFQL
jgi:LPS sulfotransferase NodH